MAAKKAKPSRKRAFSPSSTRTLPKKSKPRKKRAKRKKRATKVPAVSSTMVRAYVYDALQQFSKSPSVLGMTPSKKTARGSASRRTGPRDPEIRNPFVKGPPPTTLPSRAERLAARKARVALRTLTKNAP